MFLYLSITIKANPNLRKGSSSTESLIGSYAFISMCGGTDGPNPKLASELKKRLGKEPVASLEMHIADLLHQEPKPTRNDTMAYRINESNIKHLTNKSVETLQKVIQN